MRPETVGATETQLVLGKHSGRAALAQRLGQLGFATSGAALDRVFARFKALADRRRQVTDADLEALVVDEPDFVEDEAFSLDGLHVGCGTQGMPTATVRVRFPDGTVKVQASVGTGPVDATFKAIDTATEVKAHLLEYSVHSVTDGIDALGQVTVRVAEDGQSTRVHHGSGADTDVIVASAKAYLRALNRIHSARAYPRTHSTEVEAINPERHAS
jgi:2-isopropylmalate synthase